MHSAYNECDCSRYTFDTIFFWGRGVSAPFSEVYFLKRGYQVSTMIACFPSNQSLISHVEQLQENKIQFPDSYEPEKETIFPRKTGKTLPMTF